MSKKLEWFEKGDAIPDTAKYIKSKTEKYNYRYPHCDCHPMMNCNCLEWDEKELHLYEVYN